MTIGDLVELDPDDPRPASQQIANAIRAAIRTRRFQPGERLPSQNDLAARYGVARETIKRALDVLREERLIVARQGSGVFVRAVTERPVGLRPHIEDAFRRQHVTIDFSGFSGETLHGMLSEPLDKIRIGRLTPTSISIRMLLPDFAGPLPLPRPAGDADAEAVRGRAARISQRHIEAIVESVHELADLGLVKEATAEYRVHGIVPMFKLYVLNGSDAFFGFYPVVKHRVSVSGSQLPILDVMGKDAILFHRTASDDETSDGPAYVEEARRWFESVWSTIAIEPAS